VIAIENTIAALSILAIIDPCLSI